MRDLLPMVELLNKIIGNIMLNNNQTTAVCSTVFEYNNGALKPALGPRIIPRTKNIPTKYHSFWDKVGAGTHTEIKRVDSQYKIVDIFTKGFKEETL